MLAMKILRVVAGLVMVMTRASSLATTFPPYSWDSHIHVIDPERFPLDPDRPYTPKPATNSNASSFQSRRGISHSVIVLPSVYGTDNAVLLDTLNYFNGSARGVCVIDPETVTNETLEELHSAGVRGVRVNLSSDGEITDDDITEAVRANARVASINNWALQLYVPIKSFVALHPVIPKLGVRVVADHFASALVGSRTNHSLDTVDPYQIEGFNEVIDLVRRKLLFVKISAPYRTSDLAPLYQDMRVVAETIMLNGPEMVVYGSDWPHTGSQEGNAAVGGRLVPQEYRDINDAAIVEEFKNWAGSEQQIQRLFVDNPRRLWQWASFDT